MPGTINRWPEFHEVGLANEELAKYGAVYPHLVEGDAVSNEEHNPLFVWFQDRGRAHFDTESVHLGNPYFYIANRL